MREAELAAFATPGLPVQGVWGVMSEPGTLALFHRLVHQSSEVEIGAWETEDEADVRRSRRTVAYRQAARGPGTKTLRMSDVHEASYAPDSDTLTFELASFLHLPKGRITTARVRWVQAPMAPSGPVGAQVGTTMRTSQGKFKLLGLQGPLEGFFLSEAQHSLQRFNALLALLIHERGLSQPTNLESAKELLGKDYADLKTGRALPSAEAWAAEPQSPLKPCERQVSVEVDCKVRPARQAVRLL